MAIVLTDDKYYKEIADTLRKAMGIDYKEDYSLKPSEMSERIEIQLENAEHTGHENGYTEGLSDGYKHGYSRGKIDGFSEGKTEGYNEGYELGNADGKQDAYNTFWDSFQNYGKRNHYYYAFSYYNFDDSTYNPKYPIKTGTTNTGGMNLFYSSNAITDTKVDIEFEGTASGAFYGAKILKTIRKMIVNKKTVFSNTFYSLSTLENITFGGEIGNDINFSSCDKLTEASIRSIIDHLSSDTNGKTLTLSEKAVNKAFETSEGANDGSTSSEWNGALSFRDNWTISLV